MRVLILDTSPIFRMGLKQIMTQMGKRNGDIIEIYENDNIQEGINIARRYKPDIILIDSGIGISNIENSAKTDIENIVKIFNREKIIHRNRESGRNKGTDVIFLCDKIRYGELEEIKNLGVSGMIMKSANEEDVIYAINVVMRGGRYYSPECTDTKMSVKDNLTKRESEVLSLLKEGKSNYEISKELFISEATAKKHVSNILGKLGVKNRVEVVIAVNNARLWR